MASVRPSAAEPQDEILAQLKKATLGEYEIYGELGRGGMATVYLAHDVALDRKVAIKLMAPALLASGHAMAERFKREARTAAALSHPHVIPIYAVRESPGLLFFVMKYIEGRSLDAVIKERGPLPIRMAQVVLAQVAGALGYAHRRGVIHRDMKPANIMLDEDGWAVVTDFGIAKVADARGLTMTGVTIGTPSYMSPEQCGAREITGASDQYSLGIVAYEMLTGRVPFDADSLMGIMWQHFNDPPPPVLERRPDCPTDLAAAITRMLAKPPGERWPSLDDFVAALGSHATAPDQATMHEIRAMAKGGTGRAVRASHHTPASPVPPAGLRSPDAPTVRSDAVPAVTPSGLRAPTRVPSAASMADAPTVRSTPIRVAGAAEAAARSAPTVAAAPAASAPSSRKRLYAGIGIGVIALAVIAGVLLTRGGPAPSASAGGSEPPAASAAPVASVMLNPAAASISVGGELPLTAFTADAAGNPLANRAVAWRSTDTTVATVSAAGVARGQVRGVAAGSADIEATVEGKAQRARVTVTTVRAPVAQVTVTLAQASLAAGDSARISALAKAQDGTTLGDRPVTWTSSDSTVARVTRAGFVVTLNQGAATLVAVAEGQRSEARITVTPARVAEVVVEPTGVSLQVGGSDTLRATARDARGNPLAGRAARWQSANAGVATVSASGVVTARARGSTTITATVENRSVRVPVSVNAVPVAAVELAPARVEVEVGGNASLTVTARDARQAVLRDRAANWTSSNEAVARVSAAGLVTGIAAGDARITAQIEGKDASATVRVKPAAVAAVAVNPPAVTLTEGEGMSLSAAARDAQGAPLGDRRAQWRSENPRVATVASTGELRAVAAGTTRVTATIEEKAASIPVTVTARPAPVAVMPPPTPLPPRDTAAPLVTRPTPDAGAGAAGFVATRLSAGGRHTCGVGPGGAVICWGANERGQLGSAAGQSATEPVRIPDLGGLRTVVSGATHTCGLRGDGTAVCWGANDKGQLGAATPGRQLSPQPVAVAGNRTFTALAAGDRHTCGLTADGTAWCWGDNGSGQTGGSGGPTSSQVRGGKKFTALAAGAKHTCGIATDGAVLCWGDGFSGQLGRGARESQREPVGADLKVKATDVAAGKEHTCAVAQTGRVWCWGANKAGEVGDGSTRERLGPEEAQTPRGLRFVSVVAGADFTCALAEGGQAYCWGANRLGQLGDGTRVNRSTPVAVQSELSFAAIAAGEAHACGLPREGSRRPVCWGANAAGQLGNGTVEPRASPTPVSLDSLRRP
jgi:alpha-tubulin suppressor-like RCC1 family protein/uncharacterized protein YjdB